jgi:hypothetical protein
MFYNRIVEKTRAGPTLNVCKEPSRLSALVKNIKSYEYAHICYMKMSDFFVIGKTLAFIWQKLKTFL